MTLQKKVNDVVEANDENDEILGYWEVHE